MADRSDVWFESRLVLDLNLQALPIRKLFPQLLLLLHAFTLQRRCLLSQSRHFTSLLGENLHGFLILLLKVVHLVSGYPWLLFNLNELGSKQLNLLSYHPFNMLLLLSELLLVGWNAPVVSQSAHHYCLLVWVKADRARLGVSEVSLARASWPFLGESIGCQNVWFLYDAEIVLGYAGAHGTFLQLALHIQSRRMWRRMQSCLEAVRGLRSVDGHRRFG